MKGTDSRVHLLGDENEKCQNQPSVSNRRPPVPATRRLRSTSTCSDRTVLRSSESVPNYGAISTSSTDPAECSRGRRRPYHYHNVPGTNRYKNDSGTDASDTEVANYNRFTYISRVMSNSRLAAVAAAAAAAAAPSRSDSEASDSESLVVDIPHFTMPSHLIPAEFFIPSFVAPPHREGEHPKNSSIVTIFAIWNTMMGTSILSMPWLVEQSGMVAAIFVFIAMTSMCVFTAFRVLTMHSSLQIAAPMNDFQFVMRRVLSKYWGYLGVGFSVCILVGAMLVYWVLMSNFLFNSVEYFYDLSTGNFSDFEVNTTVQHGAYCIENLPQNDGAVASFSHIWSHKTSALLLIFFLYPVLNIKSPTFFTKFTGLGTISVLYMVIFVSTKASQFGINMNFSDPQALDYVFLFRPNFPVALGTLSLAMFIHNCICRVMEDNAQQENNVRDLFIAYCLVFITYSFIGFLFFISWPFAKSCIRDNFLDNFIGTDTLSVIARVFLFFQMFSVFPLLGFMVRVQLMTSLYGSSFPSRSHVLILNFALVLICVLVAVFYPFIGQLLRFSGAFCGMAWIFTFPCLVYLVGKYREGNLTVFAGILHVSLIIIGIVNLLLQFMIKTD